MNDTEFETNFVNPQAKFRAKPFWAWNGRLEKEELVRQIQLMKEMGFGGFFMHSRTGLQTEYLGEDWFELINDCADEGMRQGMETWLYDEDRWPSGIAGGMVTEEPHYRARFIEMTVVPFDTDIIYPENIIALFVCEMEKGYFKNLRKSDGTSLSRCEVLLIFHIAGSECKDVYNGYTYLDTMNPNAVQRFIQLTHERYKEKCGNRIGSSIRGIFTDEPHRGAMFSSFSEGGENRVPYTEMLFPAFENECGYDLKERLPYLFLREAEEPFSKTALDFVEVCQKLFLENFAEPVKNWCEKNHMLFTGHVLHEDSLSAQTVMQGSLMRFYQYMDYPGIDILTEHNNCWWVVKQAVSVARQLDKPFVLSELYGGTGWQMSLENYKQAGDWQALFGVNLRCPHLSWYTMAGEAKRDYPASIFYQSAWYKEYETLETYFSRLGVFTSQGQPECDLLVLNPIESVWGYCRKGAFSGLDGVDERICYLEERYQETFDILVRGHIDFDYGDEAILEQHGEIRDGVFYVGSCGYKKVLVTGMDTIRSSTLDLLGTFVNNGGTVIFAGEFPQYLDGLRSEEIKRMAQNCFEIKYAKEDIITTCGGLSSIHITGNGAEDILCRISNEEDIRYMMLLNSNRNKRRTDIKIDFGEGKRVEQWDARNGKISSLSELKEGRSYIETDFAAGEEKLYRIEELQECQGKSTDRFEYILSEDNVLPLDYVTAQVNGLKLEGEVLRVDRQIRDMLGLSIRSGEMLQPWYTQKYHNEQSKERWKVSLKFEFYMKQAVQDMKLAFEDVENVTGIWLNSEKIEKDSNDCWIDKCFTCIDLSNTKLRTGKNEICFDYEYQSGNGIEAVYLLGNFGVMQNNDSKMWEVERTSQLLQIGDISHQGFPFYSGKIQYILPELKGVYRLQNLKFEGSCVNIIGDSTQTLFAPPYTCEVHNPRIIELVLTRRNTFGPLHCSDRSLFAYGPESFLTERNEWQENYVLVEQGLLEKPQFLSEN